MEAEKAVFTIVDKERVDDEIRCYENTIDDIKRNMQAPDFYQGDREEVEGNLRQYERDLDRVRILKIQRELAICTGLPGMRA